MAVVWTQEGADDFLSALTYLRARNPTVAEAFARQVDATLRMLDEVPIDGPQTVIGEGIAVRSWPVPPLRAYYQRAGSDVLVIRLYDQRREPIERR